MKLDTPLHTKYKNADGPLSAYRTAAPWTKEMQDDLRQACEDAEQINRFARRVDYHCPTCQAPVEEIRFESVVFYGDDDFMQIHPLGQGQLVTIGDCGHQYRREITP
jgi:hypothetical protein